MLAGQMEYTYFPIDLNQLPARITYHDLTEGIHTIGGARVATQLLNHPAMTVGYRVEVDGAAMVYLVDHEPFSDELWRAVKKEVKGRYHRHYWPDDPLTAAATARAKPRPR